jgi:protein Mpv17
MLIIVLALFCYPSEALSTSFKSTYCVLSPGKARGLMSRNPFVDTSRRLLKTRLPAQLSASILLTRGGGDQDDEIIDLDNLNGADKAPSSVDHEPIIKTEELVPLSTEITVSHATVLPSMVLSSLQSLGHMYAASLASRPIVTKSFTAGILFALSDYTAQQINRDSKGMNWVRTLSSGLVGLVYFGPAAHTWYKIIFRLFPSTSLVSTLQKAAMGQIIFGPSFTCVFFAVSLLQARSFTLNNWWNKIQMDLPKAWIAGLSFWPLVDLVSYSIVPKDWIPLFVNFCSFIWTIYLSIVANQKK